ncbi:uncharacterized protein [Ptychodera flava]|uniref:uncharacterized protein n=1 Tax=Ptychodera flava TaxID=63121 RepID=UPI00396AA928
MMSCEGEIKTALDRIKSENQKLEGKLEQLKKLEESCQEQKELLLKEDSKIEKCCNKAQRSKLKENDHIYNQIYPVAEEICQQQYLLKDLQQQLMVCNAKEEKKNILKSIATASQYTSWSQDEDDYVPVCIRWYREMITPVSSKNMSHDGDLEKFNNLYYDVEMKTIQSKTSSEALYQLTFSTCYHGVCALITIQQSCATRENSVEYCMVTSDPFIEHLQEKALEAIKSNQPVMKFITDTVWVGIEDSIVVP